MVESPTRTRGWGRLRVMQAASANPDCGRTDGRGLVLFLHADSAPHDTILDLLPDISPDFNHCFSLLLSRRVPASSTTIHGSPETAPPPLITAPHLSPTVPCIHPVPTALPISDITFSSSPVHTNLPPHHPTNTPCSHSSSCNVGQSRR